MIKPYLDDIDHGLFHGLMVALVAQIVNPAKSADKILSSCILHDFLKANGFPHEIHDKLLIDYFPNLLPETYTHSNPSPEDAKKPLIIGDRLELRRFPDYQSWVDSRFAANYQQLTGQQVEHLDIFYRKIRPALKYFYQNRDKIFIRHGLEAPEKRNWQKKAIYPPSNSYIELGAGYAIEVDQLPFSGAQEKNRQGTYCSNHDEESPWNQIKGFISFDDFLQLGGKIINSEQRDHLYANSNIPIENWTFIHQKDSKNRHPEIESLLSLDGVSIVHQETLILFFALIKLLTTRIIVLNQSLC